MRFDFVKSTTPLSAIVYFLFQVTDYITDRIQYIASQHRCGCAKIISRVESSLRVNPCACHGGVERVESLRAQTDN
jgi:hypothetical protein